MKSTGAILHYLYSRDFYFSPESLIEASKTDEYAKNSTTFIKDMFEDLCYTYDLEIENLDEMLMHVHNTSHLGRKNYSLNFSYLIIKPIQTRLYEHFPSFL